MKTVRMMMLMLLCNCHNARNSSHRNRTKQLLDFCFNSRPLGKHTATEKILKWAVRHVTFFVRLQVERVFIYCSPNKSHLMRGRRYRRWTRRCLRALFITHTSAHPPPNPNTFSIRHQNPRRNRLRNGHNNKVIIRTPFGRCCCSCWLAGWRVFLGVFNWFHSLNFHPDRAHFRVFRVRPAAATSNSLYNL